jgi:hypothetical protein
MPLVDGALSARMIRFWEKESSAQSQYRSQQQPDGREVSPQGLVPKPRVMIIAVAASLEDENRFDYIQNGCVTSSPSLISDQQDVFVAGIQMLTNIWEQVRWLDHQTYRFPTPRSHDPRSQRSGDETRVTLHPWSG